MMVLSKPQHGTKNVPAKMYWLSINNGAVIPNDEIMTRIGPEKPIKDCSFIICNNKSAYTIKISSKKTNFLYLKRNKKAVAHLQTRNCYNINRAILFISAGDRDGDKIYPFSMTANDLFDNDLQLKQLFDNINAPKSQRNTKKQINSIVVDPFKVSSFLEIVPRTFKRKRRNNTSSCINDVYS